MVANIIQDNIQKARVAQVPPGYKVITTGYTQEGDIYYRPGNDDWCKVPHQRYGDTVKRWIKIARPEPTESLSNELSQGWLYDEQGDIITNEPHAIPQGFRTLQEDEIIQNGDFLQSKDKSRNLTRWQLVKRATGRERTPKFYNNLEFIRKIEATDDDRDPEPQEPQEPTYSNWGEWQ